VVYKHAPIRENDGKNTSGLQEHTARCLKTVRHFENRLVLCIQANEIILNSSFDRRVSEFLTGDTTPVKKSTHASQALRT